MSKVCIVRAVTVSVGNALVSGFSEFYQFLYMHLYYIATAVNLHTMSATVSILLMKKAR